VDCARLNGGSKNTVKSKLTGRWEKGKARILLRWSRHLQRCIKGIGTNLRSSTGADKEGKNRRKITRGRGETGIRRKG